MNPLKAIYLTCACLIAMGILLTLATDGPPYSALMILPAIAAAGAYTLAPQIMWWWWQRNPPDLPTELAALLNRFDLYRSLDLAGKREFRRRTFLLKEATHLHGQAIEEFPEDVRIMVAASAATVTYYRKEFLLDHFDTIIFYRHAFPTPLIDKLHTSELHEPDGAIIWTLNYFLRSAVEPQKYLHLGLYEYTRALFYLEPQLRTAMTDHALNYPQIESITQFSEEALKEFVGLDELDLPAITNVLYHTHGAAFARLEPAIFTAVEDLVTRKVILV
ncbi:hypothetical protein [Lewinella sp. 4G2]|uniref:hypothetical protein n=1 Tax=Lewinella sp. 4G2 TaxID=1803372 RepID=UPI0007B4890C|nr:hypothetical protein [Lewinella sp. 4G2]OAV43729.1 hypothetical protein A3850_004120 [Lewinella sp. 4G2]